MKYLKIFLELTKFKVSIFASLSNAIGFIMASNEISLNLLMPTIAIFLLSSGACALNQYQEIEIDKLMDRTRNRPLPSGKIKSINALITSICLIISALAILFLFSNFLTFALGLFTLLWYNAVYTLFKTKNNFALIIGLLVGSIMPAIGWFAAGGTFNSQILAIVFFFFIWQVPHNLLHILDYRKDYEKSGLPSLIKVFRVEQIVRITFIWILAVALTSLLIPLFIPSYYLISLSLFLSTLWLVYNGIKILFGENYNSAFKKINIYALMVIFLLSLNKLIY